MLSNPGIPFIYDFNKTYHANFLDNRKKALISSGGIMEILHNPTYWQQYDELSTINGITVNYGISAKRYINDVYNGKTMTCLLDTIVREVIRAINDVVGWLTGALGIPGVGDFICTITNAINDVFDAFTDLFGSFICTATLKGFPCGESILQGLKNYRDLEILTFEEGKKIVKYYHILGPKIVAAIDSDIEKDVMYMYIANKYILKLNDAITVESVDKQTQKIKIITMYFAMMDEMIEIYKIKTTKQYKLWSKEYANGGM